MCDAIKLTDLKVDSHCHSIDNNTYKCWAISYWNNAKIHWSCKQIITSLLGLIVHAYHTNVVKSYRTLKSRLAVCLKAFIHSHLRVLGRISSLCILLIKPILSHECHYYKTNLESCGKGIRTDCYFYTFFISYLDKSKVLCKQVIILLPLPVKLICDNLLMFN